MGMIGEHAREGSPIRTVVACTDLSGASEPVLLQAKAVCLHTGATLQVVHVLEQGDLSGLTPEGMAAFAEEADACDRKLHSLVKSLHVPGLLITPVLLKGSAIQSIREFVEDSSPELVVVGTSGKRGLQRLLLGSTAEALVRSVACPVLTVGPESRAYTNGPVVFATDFNPCAARDMEFALELAQYAHVPLYCVHFLPAKIMKSKMAIVTLLQEALHKLASDAGARHESVKCFVEPGRHVSQDIVEFARKTSASAIVLGVLRRSSAQSHMSSHEVFKVLAAAPCPVYTLSHSREEAVLPDVA